MTRGDNHVDKLYKDNDEDVNDMTDFESLIHRGDIWMKKEREREGWGWYISERNTF